MTLSAPSSPTALETVFKRVIERKAVRAEATLQADIRQFLLDADLNLGEQDLLTPVLEAQVGDGTGHRIDIEMGATVIEVKKDISRPKIRKDAVEQAAKAFEDENDVDVELVLKNFEDIRADFLAQVPTGEGPDITVGAHDWLGELTTNGVVAPIELG
ncbi:extracellular solute-binding protein, partial [Streptomyces sp. SID12488]|uniref:extracellular solute-binding protein n=1 Tax=Streptomyces sp. SID12488 TaxID=2706040 RepID=UPI0031BAA87C